MISIEVDGKAVGAREGSTIKEALEALGYAITLFPSDGGLFMPCQTGGCWACALDVDGRLTPACATTVASGMRIRTGKNIRVAPGITPGITPNIAPNIKGYDAGTNGKMSPNRSSGSASSRGDLAPRRLVGGFLGHQAGGVGTPWWLKGGSIEVACFTAGCNFCCPQCQNWRFTYAGSLPPIASDLPSIHASDTTPPTALLTPEQAARKMTAARRRFAVDRLAVSGGECTLNRPWLVEFLRLLREMNPSAHLHVDTNGSILTGDYIDELVQTGMTDIGIDLKALRTGTFMEICGLVDEPLAERYLQTAWQAVRYVHDNYPQVYLGVGIPYNSLLISLDEVIAMGRRIAEIDPWMQVCVLDYRPEFQRGDLIRPGFWDMMQVHYNLRDCGLLTVVCQTEKGKVGPGGRLVV